MSPCSRAFGSYALNLLHDLYCFMLSVHLVKVECLPLEESHTEALSIVTLGSHIVCGFLPSCLDLFSKVTYPKFLDEHAEARKVSRREISQVPLES